MVAWSLNLFIGQLVAAWPIKMFTSHATTLAHQGCNQMIQPLLNLTLITSSDRNRSRWWTRHWHTHWRQWQPANAPSGRSVTNCKEEMTINNRNLKSNVWACKVQIFWEGWTVCIVGRGGAWILYITCYGWKYKNISVKSIINCMGKRIWFHK